VLTPIPLVTSQHSDYDYFSAGGIVSLGLGISEMPVLECMDLFRNFATTAFTKRKGLEVPGLKYLIEAHNHSQFKSSGLKAAMKSAFGDKRLFGEPDQPMTNGAGPSEWGLKVGITLTAASGHPYLATNYNRTEPEKGPGKCHQMFNK